MKKLLLLLDSDPIPSVYDIFVGYDGGADHVVSYAGITPGNIASLIDGAIFTRGPSEKKHTAIFIGGANMAAGEELLTAVTKHFFGNFRVSVMLDSNGSNTTAAAAVHKLPRRCLWRARRLWCLPVPDRSGYVPRRFLPRKERK